MLGHRSRNQSTRLCVESLDPTTILPIVDSSGSKVEMGLNSHRPDSRLQGLSGGTRREPIWMGHSVLQFKMSLALMRQ